MEEEQVKKKGFWTRLQESKWKQVCFFVGCMGVMLLAFFPLSSLFQKMREKEILEKLNISTDYDIWFGLDKTKLLDDEIQISGWLIKKDTAVSMVRLILKNTEGTDAEIYLTESGRRKEAETSYEVNWEVGNSGFSVNVPEKKIEEDKSYEVQLVVYYDEESKTGEALEEKETYKKINTDWYLYHGELYRYDPLVFVEPTVKNEVLQQVVSKGILCGFDLKTGLYVYLYEGSLYWFVERECEYLSDSMHIPYQPRTIHVEALPEHRQKYGYDNRDFYFDEEEINVKEKDYRIAVRRLPEEYVPTYITTGIYDDVTQNWIFKVNFFMDLD